MTYNIYTINGTLCTNPYCHRYSSIIPSVIIKNKIISYYCIILNNFKDFSDLNSCITIINYINWVISIHIWGNTI